MYGSLDSINTYMARDSNRDFAQLSMLGYGGLEGRGDSFDGERCASKNRILEFGSLREVDHDRHN